MAIGGFLGGLANLGAGLGAAQDYRAREQQIAYSQALQQLQIQQARQQFADIARQNQLLSALGAATKGADIQQQWGAPAQIPSAPSYAPGQIQAQALPPQLPQVPDATSQMAMIGTPQQPGLIPRDESGGRNIMQQVAPPSVSHASGPLQIQPATYSRYAPAAGAAPLGAGELAMNRPVAEQYKVGGALFQAEGVAPWAKYNAKLAADLKLSPEHQQQADHSAMLAAGQLPPQMVGQAGPNVFAQILERVLGSNAPDDVKGLALLKLGPLMSQEGQRQLHQQLEVMRTATQDRGERERERHDVAIEERQTRGATQTAEGGHLEAPKNWEITTTATGETRIVPGRVARDRPGIFDPVSGAPIQFDPAKETIREVTPATATGGRAAAQAGRQLIAGGEVAADLKNIGSMPMGATTGWLGGLVGESGGISLLNAAKVDLANTLTDEDDVNMKIALGGLGRELSTLMSPVYGGEWASKQLEPMIPKKGYSINNALYGIARIKQSALVALEGFKTQPVVGKEQHDLATRYEEAIKRDIPWDVADVIAFLQSQNPKETFKDYAGKSGISGAATGKPPDTANQAPEITEQQYNSLPSGSPYRVPDNPQIFYKP